MATFQNPRRTTLYIILQNEHTHFHLNSLHDIMSRFDEILPVFMRPMYLLIFFSDRFLLKNSLQELLQHAWRLKFLDFSILNIDTANQFFLLNYNPFIRNYDIEYSQAEMNLFPNKLRNLENYAFKIPVPNCTNSNVSNETRIEFFLSQKN